MSGVDVSEIRAPAVVAVADAVLVCVVSAVVVVVVVAVVVAAVVLEPSLPAFVLLSMPSAVETTPSVALVVVVVSTTLLFINSCAGT